MLWALPLVLFGLLGAMSKPKATERRQTFSALVEEDDSDEPEPACASCELRPGAFRG